jgi:hypothetical protein
MSQNLTSPAREDNVEAKLKAIHERLIESWKGQKHSGFVPMIYPDFRPGSLVFVGINPSLGERDIVSVLKGTAFEQAVPTRQSVRYYFTFQPDQILHQLSDWQDIQSHHRQKLRYFKRHRTLAEAVGEGDTWQQLDLFQLRESTQVNLESLLKKNITDEFFAQQITFFFDLLELMAPKAIVIMNAKTGKILKQRWLENQSDEGILTPSREQDVFNLSFRQQHIPVIFSVHTQYKKAEESKRIDQRIVTLINALNAGGSQN